MEILFAAVSPGSLETALDWMNRLYTEAGGTHNRKAAFAAAQSLFENPATGGVWFIEVDGRTAGYVALTACFSLEFGGAFGLLDELYFAPEFRGLGLGARAIAFAEAWCRERGMRALRLEVELNNERALRLYQRQGFVTQHRDLMTKWL